MTGWLGDAILGRPLPRFWRPGGPWWNGQRRLVRRRLMRARPRPVYLGDDAVLCTVLGRYKMYVDARDLSLSPHLMLDGAWEMWVTEAVAALLRPDMVAVDAGANLGYFTLIMADLCAGGHVHAFEPNPRMADRLWRSAMVNGLAGRMTVHGNPLGAVEGAPTKLVVPERQPGGGHIVPAAEGEPAMPTRRLDGVPGARDAAFVKIDTEGSEPAIWAGMTGMIAGTRLETVLLEFAAGRYPDPAGFLAEIATAGFSLGLVHESRGMVPVTVEEILSDPHADRMLLLRRG